MFNHHLSHSAALLELLGSAYVCPRVAVRLHRLPSLGRLILKDRLPYGTPILVLLVELRMLTPTEPILFPAS